MNEKQQIEYLEKVAKEFDEIYEKQQMHLKKMDQIINKAKKIIEYAKQYESRMKEQKNE
jgi:lysozyme family protein